MAAEVDLRLLRYFVATAEELHFGRAAARLHLSQPTLSVQIRRLERMLGVQLLDRSSRHVALTAAGAVFLEESRRLLTSAERAVEAARQAAEGSRGRLVVGFLANAAAELTHRVLQTFHTSQPGVQVELQQFGFGDPSAGLASGATDVAFVRPPLAEEDGLCVEPLFGEPRMLAVASDLPLAAEPAVPLERLLDEPFVARRAPDYWRDFWLAADRRDGHPVRIGAEAATVDECFEAILDGRGVAFTQASSRRYYARPGLSFVPVTGLPPCSVAVAWRRDAATPLVRDFVALARHLAVLEPVPDSTSAPSLGVGIDSAAPSPRR
ncbi:MAG TPA: LysR substrate-binding domain-containing protein [Geodermatophilus sp.]|nr:LysR substrate-binding domain-containing protein [Geodermatophilus sp.]